MILDLPGTTVGAVTKRLTELRDDVGAMALSRVLTLLMVTDEAHADASLKVATDASHQHPSRIVCLVSGRERATSRLDGQIRVGGDAGASEIVVLRLRGDLTAHGRSVALPLLLADSPVVAWWPYDAPDDVAHDPIGSLAQRRITDAEHTARPIDAIRDRATSYAPGDTDLAWTRTTKWRGLLAAALDQPPYESVQSVTVTGGVDSASTDLLAGWLGASLDCPVQRARSRAGTGLLSVRLMRASGPIDLIRPDGRLATLIQPGQPARRMALARRQDAECLADELSRLDADEVYQRSLRGLVGITEAVTLPAHEAIATGIAPALDEADTASG